MAKQNGCRPTAKFIPKFVNEVSDQQAISECFEKSFAAACSNHSTEGSTRIESEFYALKKKLPQSDLSNFYIDLELVDKSIFNLKLG